jgi:tRNA threonylcarbamoyladenosine biosynthesis protein TsaE
MSPHPAISSLLLPTPEATAALGAAIAAELRVGEAVCLTGPLGAGKSVLARGLVRALSGPNEDVPSPTFTLVQFYVGPDFPLAHLDLYRLTNPEEAWELGLDEALAMGAAVIEWPQRLEQNLPTDRLDVTISHAPGAAPDEEAAAPRLARLAGFGSWTERVDRVLRSPLPGVSP